MYRVVLLLFCVVHRNLEQLVGGIGAAENAAPAFQGSNDEAHIYDDSVFVFFAVLFNMYEFCLS